MTQFNVMKKNWLGFDRALEMIGFQQEDLKKRRSIKRLLYDDEERMKDRINNRLKAIRKLAFTRREEREVKAREKKLKRELQENKKMPKSFWRRLMKR